MVVEIIAGVIVLILAIIGIAKLAKWRGGGGGGVVERGDLSKIDVYGLLEDADQAVGLLYRLAKTKDPKEGSRIAKDLFKYIGQHQEEFNYAIEILGHKKDVVYEELQKLRERYKEAFDAYIAKPRIEAMNKYDSQRRLMSTALSETRMAQPSWYAYWAKAISGKQAIEDTRDVLKYHQSGYELQKRSNKRKAQARMAQAAMARSG